MRELAASGPLKVRPPFCGLCAGAAACTRYLLGSQGMQAPGRVARTLNVCVIWTNAPVPGGCPAAGVRMGQAWSCGLAQDRPCDSAQASKGRDTGQASSMPSDAWCCRSSCLASKMAHFFFAGGARLSGPCPLHAGPHILLSIIFAILLCLSRP